MLFKCTYAEQAKSFQISYGGLVFSWHFFFNTLYVSFPVCVGNAIWTKKESVACESCPSFRWSDKVYGFEPEEVRRDDQAGCSTRKKRMLNTVWLNEKALRVISSGEKGCPLLISKNFSGIFIKIWKVLVWLGLWVFWGYLFGFGHFKVVWFCLFVFIWK